MNILIEPKSNRQVWSVEVLQAHAVHPTVASPTSLSLSYSLACI